MTQGNNESGSGAGEALAETESGESANAAANLADDTVIDYLRNNSDFLNRHPDLLAELAPPARWSGDSVIDMQQFMLERLRSEIDNLRASAMDLIDTSRRNLSVQNRTHAAALALLTAQTFPHMLRIVGDDLPLLLDVDTVVIGFEPPESPLPGLVLPEVRPLPVGLVDQLLGDSTDVRLLGETTDDGTVFGAASGLVRSAAFARLRPSERLPGGLIALGSRGGGAFHPGQGTELIGFLARVAERCAERLVTEVGAG